VPTPRTQRVVLIGLVVNIILALVKLSAGILGHCYALVADATESIVDIVGSVVIWSGLHIGARPPDENHPYGHGKAESLAALVVAILVFAAGVGIAYKAIEEIRTPHHTPAMWTLIVLVAAIVVKTGLARVVKRIAREEGSGAGMVDAGHHHLDVLVSLAAFVGISLAVFGARLFGQDAFNWSTADDWAALVASFIIMYNAFTLARLPLHELMDATPASELENGKKIALGVEGVRAIEKARARTSGSRHYLELHVEVDPAMTVDAAHIITGKIKHAIRTQIPAVADVLVHVEPHHPAADIAK
jgi:cation diffusion facilitator family transporter